MPTLLTTRRMSPELRSRIAQSLHSDARSRAGGQSPIQGARFIRILIALGVACLSASLFITFKKSREDFARTRAALVARYEEESKHLDAGYGKRLGTIDALLRDVPEEYPGDFIHPSIASSSHLDALLKTPFVYVRGPLLGFRRKTDRRNTWKDGGPGAFIRCYLMPPSDFKESHLLRHLGKVYQPSAFIDRFVNLDDAFEGHSFVESDFETRLRTSRHMRELSSLEAALDTAHLEAKRAFGPVTRFVYVLDEPKSQGVPSDFDGEAEHFMRVEVFDLEKNQPLYRVRRRVDPDWISEKSRLSYSRQLDSCRLAFELRAELDGVKRQTPGSPPQLQR